MAVQDGALRYTRLVALVAMTLACSGGGTEPGRPDGGDSSRGQDAGEQGEGGADAGLSTIDAGADTSPFQATTTIHYLGAGVDETVTFDDCYFCDASDVGSHTLLRYQQGQGYTIWALYIPDGATPGPHPLTADLSGFYATLSANDATLPDEARGFYFGDSNQGTVTLDPVDVSPGGSVAGSIDVRWTRGGVTAHATSSFVAQIP